MCNVPLQHSILSRGLQTVVKNKQVLEFHRIASAGVFFPFLLFTTQHPVLHACSMLSTVVFVACHQVTQDAAIHF